MQQPTTRPPSRPHGLARRLIATFWRDDSSASRLHGSAFAAPPNLILSDGNLRAYNSMTAAEIQAYLNTQPGPLKTLVTSDYDKVITLSSSQRQRRT